MLKHFKMSYNFEARAEAIAESYQDSMWDDKDGEQSSAQENGKLEEEDDEVRHDCVSCREMSYNKRVADAEMARMKRVIKQGKQSLDSMSQEKAAQRKLLERRLKMERGALQKQLQQAMLDVAEIQSRNGVLQERANRLERDLRVQQDNQSKLQDPDVVDGLWKRCRFQEESIVDLQKKIMDLKKHESSTIWDLFEQAKQENNIKDDEIQRLKDEKTTLASQVDFLRQEVIMSGSLTEARRRMEKEVRRHSDACKNTSETLEKALKLVQDLMKNAKEREAEELKRMQEELEPLACKSKEDPEVGSNSSRIVSELSDLDWFPNHPESCPEISREAEEEAKVATSLELLTLQVMSGIPVDLSELEFPDRNDKVFGYTFEIQGGFAFEEYQKYKELFEHNKPFFRSTTHMDCLVSLECEIPWDESFDDRFREENEFWKKCRLIRKDHNEAATELFLGWNSEEFAENLGVESSWRWDAANWKQCFHNGREECSESMGQVSPGMRGCYSGCYGCLLECFKAGVRVLKRGLYYWELDSKIGSKKNHLVSRQSKPIGYPYEVWGHLYKDVPWTEEFRSFKEKDACPHHQYRLKEMPATLSKNLREWNIEKCREFMRHGDCISMLNAASTILSGGSVGFLNLAVCPGHFNIDEELLGQFEALLPQMRNLGEGDAIPGSKIQTGIEFRFFLHKKHVQSWLQEFYKDSFAEHVLEYDAGYECSEDGVCTKCPSDGELPTITFTWSNKLFSLREGWRYNGCGFQGTYNHPLMDRHIQGHCEDAVLFDAPNHKFSPNCPACAKNVFTKIIYALNSIIKDLVVERPDEDMEEIAEKDSGSESY